MRFISWSSQRKQMAGMPPKAFLDAMDQLTQEAAKAGCVMVEGRGIAPDFDGCSRADLPIGKVTVMDGPFTEAKEVVGGFAIFDAPSKAEMLEMDHAASWIFTRRTFQAGRANARSARSRGQAKSCATKPTRRRRPRSNAACGGEGRCVSR